MLGTHRSVIVGRGVGKGHVTRGTDRKVVKIGTWIEAVTAIRVEYETTLGNRGCTQCVTIRINGTVDIRSGRNVVIQYGILAGADCIGHGNRSVIGTRDSNCHGLLSTHRTIVVGGGISEGHITCCANGEIIEIRTRIEAVTAIGIEHQ